MEADLVVAAKIKEALTVPFDAFVEGNIDKWVSSCVPDSDLAWIGTGPEEFARGHQQLRQMLEDSLVGISDRVFELTWETISRQGEVAWVVGEATIGAHAAGGDVSLTFRYTAVLVEREGRWLIANFHQSVGDARQTGPTWDSLLDTIASDVTRERPPLTGGALEGTVTLLFSDIEGSTELNEWLGDIRWMEVLREHNAIVRLSVQAFAGHEVKTIGDAFMVAFSSARRAVQCAMEIQRAFSAYGREHPDSVIRVRIGLHAGEPVRDADDFYGRSVVLASRIAGQAVGGEILVSSLLKELVEAAGDVAFGEPRQSELKGLAGTHVMHPVTWQF